MLRVLLKQETTLRWAEGGGGEKQFIPKHELDSSQKRSQWCTSSVPGGAERGDKGKCLMHWSLVIRPGNSRISYFRGQKGEGAQEVGKKKRNLLSSHVSVHYVSITLSQCQIQRMRSF